METKQAIRKTVFQRRKEADPARIKTDSAAICQKLCSLPAFREASWIYLYIDYKNEVMTEGIMKEALKQGKRVAAPKVTGKDMIFYEITSAGDLEPGYFGILEPKEGLLPTDQADAFLVMPGVAFDKNRNRTGYGGGFYDRYLEKHPHLYKAAIAFEFQMMEQVPTEPTDIVPDILITESEIY